MHVGELLRDDGLDYFAELERRRDDITCARYLIKELVATMPGPWVADAACRGSDTAAFFPDRGEPAAGKELCAGCPVRNECEAWADRLGAQQVGIAAGMSEGERQRRRGGRREVVEDLSAPRCRACEHRRSGRYRSGLCSACYAAWNRLLRSTTATPDPEAFDRSRRAETISAAPVDSHGSAGAPTLAAS